MVYNIQKNGKVNFKYETKAQQKKMAEDEIDIEGDFDFKLELVDTSHAKSITPLCSWFIFLPFQCLPCATLGKLLQNTLFPRQNLFG